MSEDVISEEIHNGYRVQVVFDRDPLSPRDADNLGIMLCGHKRYILGDASFKKYIPEWDDVDAVLMRGASPKVLLRYLSMKYGTTVVLPLYLYDHSGLSISVGGSAGWDSGFVGVIFDTERTRGLIDPTDSSKIEEYLRSEVDTYDRFLTGQVYAVRVKDRTGSVIEYCGGFYDEKDAMAEGKAMTPDAEDRSLTLTEALTLVVQAADEGRVEDIRPLIERTGIPVPSRA